MGSSDEKWLLSSDSDSVQVVKKMKDSDAILWPRLHERKNTPDFDSLFPGRCEKTNIIVCNIWISPTVAVQADQAPPGPAEPAVAGGRRPKGGALGERKREEHWEIVQKLTLNLFFPPKNWNFRARYACASTDNFTINSQAHRGDEKFLRGVGRHNSWAATASLLLRLRLKLNK